MFRLLLNAVIAAAPLSPSLPDPATIVVPDIKGDTRPLGNEKKFFVFHRDATSFAEAKADIRFCMRYINQTMFPPIPDYIPWDERAPAGATPRYAGIIGQIVVDGVARSLRQSNIMRCMLPRGYARYRISEQLWRELNYRDLESSILVQAKIASGPTPPTPRTLP